MTITRVTQSMMMERSAGGLQQALTRLARTQEQLSTGRVLNRPSDSPTDTTSAMRVRDSLAAQAQFSRNATDGLGWLDQADAAISSSLNQVRRARELALQGASAGTSSPQAREALAAEIDQLRESLLSTANAVYLERPVFGGVTTGRAAYDATGAYVGTPGSVERAIGEGVRVRVDVEASTVFGGGATSATTVFEDLADLAVALRTGDTAGIQDAIDRTGAVLDRMTSTLADVGTRAARVERAVEAAADATLRLTANLSTLENVDLPRAMVDLQMQEVAYQASLAATARVMQPSLLDFLR